MANIGSFKVDGASYTYDMDDKNMTKEKVTAERINIINSLIGNNSGVAGSSSNVQKIIRNDNFELKEGDYCLVQPILYANYIDAMQIPSNEKIIGNIHFFDQGYYIGNPALYNTEELMIGGASPTGPNGTDRNFPGGKDNGADFLFIIYTEDTYDVTKNTESNGTLIGGILSGSNCRGIYSANITKL